MGTEPGGEAGGTIGDPIPDVFSPDDPVARFVVSMSMANNDINRAFRDLLRSGDDDTPDLLIEYESSSAICWRRSTP